MIRRLPRLLRDRHGAAAVEFGLLAPAFLLMFLGVLQVGVGLHAYNSLRNVSSDTARQVSVQYQTDNRLSNSQIRSVGIANATTAPYLLKTDRLTVTADDAATQRVPNAREITLRFQYRVPTFLEFAGIQGPQLSYARPIFVSLG
ncbi:MAG TPA: TadE/TadG family type IV pilus assembly protein [Croceibacterium sp.]|nr:TadE/TadG family type IV pilus assembly protein [Croceibacterium sp.]